MDIDWSLGFQPSFSKACSRCHSRKVKCDQRVPRCTRCEKQGEECNITEFVAYSYATVGSLQAQIRDLQAKLAIASRNAAPNHATITVSEAQIAMPAAPPPPMRAGQAPWVGVGKEAEEVGFLAIGGRNRHSDDKYVGSATGSTFARIFFKQLNLVAPAMTGRYGDSLEQPPSERMASLPAQAIASFLLRQYIARVHTWWPVLQLPILRRTFRAIYEDHRKCGDADKFIVFIVLGLASSESQDHKEYQSLMDMNEPLAYFQTSLRFFKDFHDHPRDLFGIQAVILLTIWMLNSASGSDCNDLWHLSRYVMSAAIEAGLHRHNTDWGFGAEELEIRNRTWWCAYNLERQAAVVTGRVLSIRDHAIHALMPVPLSFDALSGPEALVAPVYHKHTVRPFSLMIRLRQISGRILESIYIGRGPDGKALATSFQQICTMSDESRRDLTQWKQHLDEADLKPSREYSEMKIEYCILQLLLNRPSPTFMVPSSPMIATCSKAAASAIHQWSKIEARYGISAVCRCFRQLHAILLAGLAALYCDWQAMAMAREAGPTTSPRRHRHWNDTATCLDLLERGIPQLKLTGLNKYKDLLQAVRNKVYAESMAPPRTAITPHESFMGPESLDSMSVGSMGYDAGSSLLFAEDKGMETYLNQVTGFFDGGIMDMDEALNAWYGAVMEEMQPMQTGSYEQRE